MKDIKRGALWTLGAILVTGAAAGLFSVGREAWERYEERRMPPPA